MSASGAGWVELAVSGASDDLDAIADLLGEYAPGAVWIEPAIETSDHRDFAYRVLEHGTVRAALPAWSGDARAELQARLDALELGAPAGPLLERPVEEHDWAEEWKRFYRTLHVGNRLVVRPSWEEYAAAPGEVVVVLDPGAAFGTGQHPSTRLCLSALEEDLEPGARVLDLGCGSGILAVAAAALGAREVLGVDIDAEAVRAAERNAAVNGLEERVRTGTGSLGAGWPWPANPPAAAFDLVVANISAAALMSLLPEIAAAVRPGGRFIGAGFIDAASEDVRTAAATAGLRTLREAAFVDDSGTRWCCQVAVRDR